MVVLLVVLTVVGCIGVDLALRRRERAVAEARTVREPAPLLPIPPPEGQVHPDASENREYDEKDYHGAPPALTLEID